MWLVPLILEPGLGHLCRTQASHRPGFSGRVPSVRAGEKQTWSSVSQMVELGHDLRAY